MEILLLQHFEFATITPYKNYTRICDKEHAKKYYARVDGGRIRGPFDLTISDFEESPLTRSDYDDRMSTLYFNGHRPLISKKGKTYQGNGKYFYNENNPESIPLEHVYRHEGCSFRTTSNRHIKQHYGDPFSGIQLQTITRKITKTDNKITLKVYKQNRSREVNCKYFRKSSTISSLTVNLSTGNFTIMNFDSSTKGQKKHFKTNAFGFLELNAMHGFLGVKKSVASTYSIYPEFIKVIDDSEFCRVMSESLGITHMLYTESTDHFIRELITRFVELKKIKVPNDYYHWIRNYYPTEKYLKKNDRKLISSILDRFEIKSKVTIKILHKFPRINVSALAKLCYLFGDDYPKYIGTINDDVFRRSQLNGAQTLGEGKPELVVASKNHKYNLGNHEKENLIKILNCNNVIPNVDVRARNWGILRDTTINVDVLSLFYDHFRMIQTLREFKIEVSLMAKSYNEFNTEHAEFAKLYSLIKKGTTIEYEFDSGMIKEIESPTYGPIYDKETGKIDRYVHFIPYVLKREEEYNEEGKFMHHCVASYVNQDKSIIISLRTDDGKERVTSEFDVNTGVCFQSQYFCNQTPPGHFSNSLDILKIKVRKMAHQKKLHYVTKNLVPIKINGVELTQAEVIRAQPAANVNEFDLVDVFPF